MACKGGGKLDLLPRKHKNDEFPLIGRNSDGVPEAVDTTTANYGSGIKFISNFTTESPSGSGDGVGVAPVPVDVVGVVGNHDHQPEHTQSQRDGTHRQHMTRFLYLLTFVSAIGGFLFGYDTGIVSGALLLVRPIFRLTSGYQELVVSVTVGTAAVCSLLAGIVNERFGRKAAVLVSCLVFFVGAIVLGLANNVAALLSGRIIVGIGIGFASVTVPVYIAESAPAHLRGRLVTVFQLNITFGLLVSSIIAGAFSYDVTNGWRYMFGLAAVPAVVQFVAFIFMPESPRWLLGKENVAKAREVLQLVRGKSDVEYELTEIQLGLDEARDRNQSTGGFSTFIQMLRVKHVRRALLIGCCLQMFQQICGINTIIYYTATIIRMSGVEDTSSAIWLTAVAMGVNVIFTFVGLYLVERIGRRPLILGSMAGILAGLVVLAAGFQIEATYSASVELFPLETNSSGNCYNHRRCDDCTLDRDCGFCYVHLPSGPVNGSCLPVLRKPSGLVEEGSAVSGACRRPAISGPVSWTYNFCPSNVAWLITLGIALYLACFASGMGPMPWTINAEIYPLWARSTGNAVATAVNWFFNLLVSLTFLSLMEGLTRSGTFWMFACLTSIGLLVIGLCLPETKGLPLEQMEQLFKGPLCRKTWPYC